MKNETPMAWWASLILRMMMTVGVFSKLY